MPGEPLRFAVWQDAASLSCLGASDPGKRDENVDERKE
jgi:hypothetical protein